jgi:hypothetical protein
MDEGEFVQYPGTPAEINFLRRLREIRVNTGSVVLFYFLRFHRQIIVDNSCMGGISDVGQSIGGIGVQKTRKRV